MKNHDGSVGQGREMSDSRPTTEPTTKHWQSRLAELATAHRVPGAALGILRVDDAGNDEIVEAAHGVLSLATQVPVTTDTVFQLGSIGKVWTTTLIMRLVDEGKLDLDAPVVDVLPDLRLSDAELAKTVTVRHLLTHTSGIDGDVFADTGRGDDCLEKYVEGLADVPVNHPIGATMSYCNSGFVLAGRIIEVLTGQTWDAALRERVFQPLGLERALTLPEQALLHRAAVGHLGEPDEELRSSPVWGLPRSVGPAGLVTAAVGDVLTFARMHLMDGVHRDGTRVLSERSATAMRQPQVDVPTDVSFPTRWGLGWMLGEWDGHQVVGHDGATIGQVACLRLLPEQRMAVVMLTNGGETYGLYEDLYREILRDVAGVAMGSPVAPPETAADVDVSRYLGTYERTGQLTEIISRDDGLVLRTTATEEVAADLDREKVHEFALTPVADGVFVAPNPAHATWLKVTCYELADGTSYLHVGFRANRKVA